ncbi:MAG TPA: L-seryl-tRNA(Sec) selenium transferase [Myxococcota bacterium]|nr:L-seryl-tRNA(Sec) selenium transferase [Myxococcota bacterium]
MSSALFRQLPKVDRLLAEPLLAELPTRLATDAAREVLDELRVAIGAGELRVLPDVPRLVLDRAEAWRRMRLRRVINATGVVLHTNLGRAPLPEQAAQAVAEVARGYSNCELELSSGHRGGRLDGVRGPLRNLLGCEDAIAVNNNAAAVLLALAALARGREVIVSRGELVEIGGSFRIPEVCAQSGARLVEVGTTNRTHAADYAAAITERTGVLLRVHPSNFRILGFTERPSTSELAEIARRAGLPLVEDLGSGALVSGLGDEPLAGDVLRDGADLVCFSGDKLLGGPQAGILAGRADCVRGCREHALYRALRLDKLALAALEATLRVYVSGDLDSIPTLRMLRGTVDPTALLQALSGCGLELSIEDDVGYTGGGALPGVGLPTRVVALRGSSPDELAAALRANDPPVVARVARDAVLLDPRTLLPGDVEVVADAVCRAVATG